MIFGYEVYSWTYQYFIFYGNATHVKKGTGMVDEYVLAYMSEPTKIGVEGSEYYSTLIELRTDYFTQALPYLVNVCRSVERSRQLYGTVYDFIYFEIFRIV